MHDIEPMADEPEDEEGTGSPFVSWLVLAIMALVVVIGLLLLALESAA